MNMEIKFRRVLSLVLLFVSAFSMKAQDEAYNSFSPYSIYGIGNISRLGTTVNRSMGGVGIAMRDKRVVNIMNPASVTERDAKSFMADIGLYSENKIYKQRDLQSVNNTFNISHFVASFPVYKSFTMYGGFMPYSDLGYRVTAYETDKSIIGNTGNITYNAEGYGGLNKVFLGGALDVLKGLSVGAEFGYIFGNLHKNNSLVMEKTDFRSIYSGYEMKLHSIVGKFGAQYAFSLGGNKSAVIGATYSLKSNIRGSVRDFEYGQISSVTDTSRNVINYLSEDNRVKIAGELGIGVALKGGDKWTAEVNYVISDWTDCGMDVDGFSNIGNSVFSATTSQAVRGGFTIVPNRNDIRYYMKTVTYRAGAYWEKAYYKLDGNTVNSFGLTFGATLPVFRLSNGLSLGMEIGQRGSLKGNMVRERFVNFTIGLNIFDIWFLKAKYD